MNKEYIINACLQHPRIIEDVMESGIICEENDKLSSIKKVYKKVGKLPSLDTLLKNFDYDYHETNEADVELIYDEMSAFMKDKYLFELQDLANGTLAIVEGKDFDIETIKELEKKYIKDYDAHVENYEVMTCVDEIASEIDDVFTDEDKISSGFDGIDASLDGGFIRGDTYCFVAPSGVGKSIWLVNIARKFLSKGDTVVYVTTEMSIKQTKQRLYKSYTNKSNTTDIKGILSKFKGQTFNFFPIKVEPGTTGVAEIEDIIKSQNVKPDVIIIDYMDELKASEKTPSEYEKYKILGTDLKRFAERFDCPMVTASQTNRSAFEDGATKSSVGLESIGDSWNKVKMMSGIFTIIQPPAFTADDNGIGFYELSLQKSRYSGKGNSWYKIDYKTMHISGAIHDDAKRHGQYKDTDEYAKEIGAKRPISRDEAIENSLHNGVQVLDENNNIHIALEKYKEITKNKKKGSKK